MYEVLSLCTKSFGSHGPNYQARSSNILLSLWTKSYDVTILIKRLQQYFQVVLFIQYVVLTRMKSYAVTIQMAPLQQYFRLVLFYSTIGSKSFRL